jgi:DNA modification methylase
MASPIKREVIIGDCRLLLGDCLSIIESRQVEADFVLTDPPYGIGYRSGYATDALWGESRTIANDLDARARDAFVALWRSGQATPMLVFGSRKVAMPDNCRMVLVWDKGPALGMGALDLPWKPSSEEIYVIGKGFVGPRDESNVLYCPPVQSMAKNGRLHPNEKPVPLLRRLLQKAPAGTVLDGFMGSGSTGVACIEEGRPFIGIEIDEGYFDIACRRLQDAVDRPDMFVSQRSPEPIQQPLFGEPAA